MAVRNKTERQIPKRGTLVEALVDRRKFADILDFHGGTKKFGRIHRELDIFMEEDKKLDDPVVRELILMPRGHLKTTWCTVLSVLHDIYVNPNIRIYIGSASQALAKAILREITSYLVDPWLQDNVWNNRPHFSGRLIPLMDRGAVKRRQEILELTGEISEIDIEELFDDQNRKVIWTTEAKQVIRTYKLKEPTIVIGSVESPATGFHYDKIYFDDIINFNNYDKPEKVERLDVWRNDMMSVLDPCYFDDDLFEILKEASGSNRYINAFKRAAFVGDFVRVVGTRYFKHDWYGQLLEPDSNYTSFVRNIYQNGRDNSDGYVWFERWNEREEKKRRKEMTKRHFAAQYLNNIIVEGEQILPFDRIQFISSNQIKKQEGSSTVLIRRTDDDVREVKLRLCIDPAVIGTENSDYTAIAVGGKDFDANLYILECKLFKLASSQWIKEMYALCDKWSLKTVHLETIAFAAELKNTIKNEFSKYYLVSIRDYKPSNKISKKERIESGLEPLISNGMLYLNGFLAQDSRVVDQFNYFPSEVEKDDALDVIQMVNEVAMKTLVTTNKVVPMHQRKNLRWGGYR